MLQKSLTTLLAITLFCLLTTSAFASGFNIYEHGAKGTGMAGAFSARADDASAVFFNPAGLVYLDGWNMYIGGTILIPEVNFAGVGPFPGYGVVETTKDRTFYPPALYLSKKLSKDFAMGIGVYAPFALATDWDNPEEFAGRYISQKSELTGAYISPSFAYAYNKMFSFGINANFVYSTVELRKVVNKPFYGQILDIADMKLTGDNGFAFGFDAGVLIKPMEKLQLGFVYRSEITNEYDGDAEFTQKTSGDASLDAMIAQALPANKDGKNKIGVSAEIPFPAQMVAGLMYKPTEQLSLEFDFVQFGWSAFDKLPMNFSDKKEEGDINTPEDEEIPEDYEDSIQLRFGLEYMVTPDLALRLGYVYDQTPVPDESVSPFLPDNDRNDLAFGLGYTINNITIDFSYLNVDFGTRSTNGKNRDDYNGTYASMANLYSIGIGYKF